MACKEVMMSIRKDICDNWMWNQKPLGIFMAAFAAGSIVLAAALYPALGLSSLFFLLMALIGPFIGLIYGYVGRKVQALKQTFSASDGELAECLMVNGNIQSPGIAVMGEGELILAPIVGKRVTVKLSEIRSYRLVTFFNGKTLIGKKGFYLDTGVRKRIGFAVVGAIAAKWASRFRQAGIRAGR
jgi:hypothetical protein